MNNNNSNVPKDPRGAATSPTMDMVLNGAGRNSFDPQENPTTPSMKQTRDGSSNEPSPTSVILDDGTHQLFTEVNSGMDTNTMTSFRRNISKDFQDDSVDADDTSVIGIGIPIPDDQHHQLQRQDRPRGQEGGFIAAPNNSRHQAPVHPSATIVPRTNLRSVSSGSSGGSSSIKGGQQHHDQPRTTTSTTSNHSLTAPKSSSTGSDTRMDNSEGNNNNDGPKDDMWKAKMAAKASKDAMMAAHAAAQQQGGIVANNNDSTRPGNNNHNSRNTALDREARVQAKMRQAGSGNQQQQQVTVGQPIARPAGGGRKAPPEDRLRAKIEQEERERQQRSVRQQGASMNHSSPPSVLLASREDKIQAKLNAQNSTANLQLGQAVAGPPTTIAAKQQPSLVSNREQRLQAKLAQDQQQQRRRASATETIQQQRWSATNTEAAYDWSNQVSPTPALAAEPSSAYFSPDDDGDDEDYDHTEDDESVADAGIAIRPGAFAVQGVSSSNNDDSGSTLHYHSDHEEELQMETGGSTFFNERASLSMRSVADGGVAVESNDGSVMLMTESNDIEEGAVVIDPNEAIQAELYEGGELVEDAKVVVEEDEEHWDPKTRRRLRILQVVVVCFSIAGMIGVVVSGVTGFGNSGKVTPEPVITGWKSVGDQIFLPNVEEPLEQFGSALVISQDGNSLIATAPGVSMDALNRNIGQAKLMQVGESAQQVNGSVAFSWDVAHTMLGLGVNENPTSSLASSSDLSVVAVGYPLVAGRTGRVQVFEADEYDSDTVLEFDINTTTVTGFGYAVDINSEGTLMAIGAPLYEPEPNALRGLVRIYRRQAQNILGSQDEWIPVGDDILGMNDDEMLGWSLSLSNNRLVVGAPFFDIDRGLVRVYEILNDETFVQVGQDILGTQVLGRFGESVSISDDGTVLAIGARGSAFDYGHVMIYRVNGEGEWIADSQRLVGKQPGDGFGSNVALTGDAKHLAVGAPMNNAFGLDSGMVRVWKHQEDTNTWLQEGSDIGGTVGSNLGSSVALTVNADGILRVAAGGPSADFDGSVIKAGSVSIYDRAE